MAASRCKENVASAEGAKCYYFLVFLIHSIFFVCALAGGSFEKVLGTWKRGVKNALYNSEKNTLEEVQKKKKCFEKKRFRNFLEKSFL